MGGRWGASGLRTVEVQSEVVVLLEGAGRGRESRSRMVCLVEGVGGVVTALRLCIQVLGRVSRIGWRLGLGLMLWVEEVVGCRCTTSIGPALVDAQVFGPCDWNIHARSRT